MRNRSTVYTLGNRLTTIENELESTIIIPHASQKSEVKYSIENIFRSEQFALLDNAINESLFLTDFFMVRDKNAHDLFVSVFAKTIALYVVRKIYKITKKLVRNKLFYFFKFKEKC